ncbi:hypothetical protein AKI39_13250 [Bordetella sp. H567]|uniref:hypothetical protein n=1 Tax=Bordetella sp. H567 TaxID=1697043 RepID=UPI00081D0DE1|nr:hypothetical protein [Bordetella sp. H567]AOB31448.1 hypothetical protein AKI39_13250 [Bordetella sp. H567]
MTFKTLSLPVLAATALAVFTGFYANAAWAQASISTLAAFTACDGGFFRALRQEAAAWSSAPLRNTGDTSGIKVPDRNDDNGNRITFAQPIQVGPLSLTGYVDQYADLDSMGKFIFWGFTIRGGVDETLKALIPLVKDGNRLRKDDDAYARTDVRVANSPWFPVPATHGKVPGPGRTERVLLIEPAKDGQSVSLLCSLQGSITPELLAEARPDIPKNEYPESLRADLFETTEPSATALEAVRQAIHGKELWKPKFRMLSYTVRMLPRNGKQANTYTVKVVARPDGLVEVLEDYGGLFSVQRLQLADIVQLKARVNGGSDGRVTVTTKLDLTLPAALTPGAALDVSRESQARPPKPEDKPVRDKFHCEVRGKFEANRIHPALPGQATGLVCRGSPKEPTRIMAFIDDLGVVISLLSEDQLTGAAPSPVIDVKLER